MTCHHGKLDACAVCEEIEDLRDMASYAWHEGFMSGNWVAGAIFREQREHITKQIAIIHALKAERDAALAEPTKKQAWIPQDRCVTMALHAGVPYAGHDWTLWAESVTRLVNAAGRASKEQS